MSHHVTSIRRFSASGTAALLLTAILGHSALAQAPASSSPGPAAASISAPTQDIREIRGPKPIPSAWLIPLIALSTLLSVGAAWAAWKWYRRRIGLFLQTPVEIALARLEYARGLMLPDLGRDFSIEVSSIVREYIESRFRVMAAHLTTHEFLQDALGSADPVLAANQSLLAGFLESCDLAKFGGWNLSIHDMEAMLQGARRFIVESAAQAAEPTTAPGPAKPTSSPASSSVSETSSVTPRETYGSLPST
jgi:hypothetical protein